MSKKLRLKEYYASLLHSILLTKIKCVEEHGGVILVNQPDNLPTPPSAPKK